MEDQQVVISDASPKKDGSEWAVAVPKYNKQFVEELKSRIHPSARRWDPQTKVWVVQDEWLRVAEEVIVKHFPDAEVFWYE